PPTPHPFPYTPLFRSPGIPPRGPSSPLSFGWFRRATRSVALQPHEQGVTLEGPEIKFAEAVLDNGKFGTRTVRFEAGRLAQQAQDRKSTRLNSSHVKI